MSIAANYAAHLVDAYCIELYDVDPDELFSFESGIQEALAFLGEYEFMYQFDGLLGRAAAVNVKIIRNTRTRHETTLRAAA